MRSIIVVLVVLILSSGPLSVQAISKIMRNTLKCQTEQQNSWKERKQQIEARTIIESELKPAETLSYPELRDLLAPHLKPHSQTAASEATDGDIVRVGQCEGLGSEWVNIIITWSSFCLRENYQISYNLVI